MAMGSKKRETKGKLKGRLRSKKRDHDNKFNSDKQEAATAERLGGTVQRASGATANHKGDVKTDDFLIENKTTMHASMSVTGKWLAKINREARMEGRSPALEIEIRGIDDPTCEKTWIMVPTSVFAAMREEME